MNRIFVIADTHFSHKKVTEFRPFKTVEGHDKFLVESWNSVVKKDDTVWHLGDVYLGGRDRHTILASLNGIKKLVMGNHDSYPLEIYSKYFSRIFGAAELGGCILTHVPVHPYQLEFRFRKNIHGHMHSKKLNDPRYVCVSVEQTNYRPVLLNEIVNS